ncbi:hypothetical protein EVAR_90999_1 [Eumeta japonica]|uniref:Retrovirus-related Pol polyprotein from transposon TNT 1-94-like beta-barrel domain-containing protein n=1 Tax=Eumeta variegata TaxID=151549 RepID=A0A4C1Z3H4_EUMVA|nr:hypothetical protein EVAR_90999_1 [Eumeta japonica]
MSNSGYNPFHIDRLVGRDNYASWKFAVQNAITCKEVWESLEQAFNDSGLYRRLALLRDLITTTLESSRSLYDYVSKIMSTAHKFRNIKLDIDDEWLGTLMLAGLPEAYKPMIMRLESSAFKISADSIKSKLLQEVECSDNSAFFTRKKPFKEINMIQQRSTMDPDVTIVTSMDTAKNCRAPKNKTLDNTGGNKDFVAAFSASPQTMNPDLCYVDSGASMHMTNRRDWMYDVTSPPIPTITVANKTPLPVENMKGMGHLNSSDVNKLPERVEGVQPFSDKNKGFITCATCL